MNENDVLNAIADSNDASLYGAGGYSPSSYGASSGGGGWLDQLTAIGTGYLSRRVDVDIQRRMATTGTVGVGTDQRLIWSTPQAGLGLMTANGGINLSTVLPLALLAIAAVVVLKRI